MERPNVVHIYPDKPVVQLAEASYDDWILREATWQIADRFGGLDLVEKVQQNLENRGAYRPGVPEMALLNAHRLGISEYVIAQAANVDKLERERIAKETYQHIFRDSVLKIYISASERARNLTEVISDRQQRAKHYLGHLVSLSRDDRKH